MDVSIVGKLVLKGDLELLSPILIGASKQDNDVDTCILRDYNDLPFIPATSIVGVLKHRFCEQIESFGTWNNEDFEKQGRYYWGGQFEERQNDAILVKSSQSALIMDDAILIGDEFTIRVRDGVSISPKTGTAIPKKKYDYEVLEPGCRFRFNCEVNIRGLFDHGFFMAVTNWIAKEMSAADFKMGAMTSKGFGRLRLSNWEIHEYNFEKNSPADAIAWLKQAPPEQRYQIIDAELIKQLKIKEKKAFSLQAYFNINNSLIIKDYATDLNGADAVHLKSKGKPILPGTSLRGAIRARSERIIKALGAKDDTLIKLLFGTGADENNKEPQKGRLQVEETEITINENTKITEEIQYRIKIDRFTGGVISGALFDSMPLWSGENKAEQVEIKISIENNYQNWEAALMLLVLKDLWNGDLALGGEKNVGRGTLQGQKAVITLGSQEIIMEHNNGEMLLYRQNDEKTWDEEVAGLLEGLLQDLIKKLHSKDEPESEVSGHAK